MSNIHEAMSKVMAEIKGVPKAGWNPSQKFLERNLNILASRVYLKNRVWLLSPVIVKISCF